MCGIAGHVSAAGPGDREAVRRMTDAMRHRGPDAGGLWVQGRAALGHRRLSIIDLSPEATQPLLNEDEAVGIVVNGEIYNFESLREGLVARGHTFRSRSDSEVIVHLYEEHGPDFVEKLDGMFALALWDGRAERLVLARDRSGKKPLFHRSMPGGGVAFASEVQALVRAFPGLPVSPDLGALDEYLTLQYVPSPRTAYREIRKLEAAHVAVLERGHELALRRYWRKPRGPELQGSADELARELRRLLERAVKRRLVSDVPLGAFLSGGLDSSTIVGLMATQTSRPVKTFSIGFPDAADSELPYARMVADRFRTDHHETVVTPKIADVLLETVRHHGEPFADSSAVATYYLAKVTREHVTVALSGDAGDEAFAGYARYTAARVAHVYDALPRPLRAAYQRGARLVVRTAARHLVPYVDRFADGEAVRYPYIMCQFTPEEKLRLYGARMRDAMSDATTRRFAGVLAESGRASSIGRLIDLDWHTYLVDDINVKVDIASMAHSLEVRCPFLDTEVVEFAARLPARMLMRLRGKYILRKAVADLVPVAIRRRLKRGFGLPLRRWMREDLASMVRDVLLDKTARERGLFDPVEVARLVEAIPRERDAADRVWTLLVLELWMRELVDGRG
jgi:asparagine synthase (glutamine-hydrolysing)